MAGALRGQTGCGEARAAGAAWHLPSQRPGVLACRRSAWLLSLPAAPAASPPPPLPAPPAPPLTPQTADSKLRMLASFWNVCDLLSFAPPLVDAALRATGTSVRWAWPGLAGAGLAWAGLAGAGRGWAGRGCAGVGAPVQRLSPACPPAPASTRLSPRHTTHLHTTHLPPYTCTPHHTPVHPRALCCHSAACWRASTCGGPRSCAPCACCAWACCPQSCAPSTSGERPWGRWHGPHRRPGRRRVCAMPSPRPPQGLPRPPLPLQPAASVCVPPQTPCPPPAPCSLPPALPPPLPVLQHAQGRLPICRHQLPPLPAPQLRAHPALHHLLHHPDRGEDALPPGALHGGWHVWAGLGWAGLAGWVWVGGRVGVSGVAQRRCFTCPATARAACSSHTASSPPPPPPLMPAAR